MFSGATCVALVFLVEHMGALIQAGKSLAGITAGSLLGLFSMGLFLPWINATVMYLQMFILSSLTIFLLPLSSYRTY